MRKASKWSLKRLVAKPLRLDKDPKSGLKLVFKLVTYKNSVKKVIEFSLKRSRKINSERNKKRSSARKTKLKTIERGIKLE